MPKSKTRASIYRVKLVALRHVHLVYTKLKIETLTRVKHKP